MEHKHGPKCGCKEYLNIENSEDLYSAIDLAGIQCLNESQNGRGRTIFKSDSEKLDHSDFVESDDPDAEMIFIIPFIYEVKLKSINVIAKDSGSAANRMKVYANIENVDFSITQDQNALEEFRLVPNLDGTLHSAVRQSKFQNVTKLILYVYSDNPAVDVIGLSFIGLRGDMTKIKRQIVETTYEIKPLAEEKNPEELLNGMLNQNF